MTLKSLKAKSLRIVAILLCWVNASASPASGTSSSLSVFFAENCLDCHDDSTSKGGLNLAALPDTFNAGGYFNTWKRVLERVVSGEMPPPKKGRPNPERQQAFVTDLTSRLIEADQNDIVARGRVRSRRLTRREYENTLQDLLGIDLLVQDRLPEDPVPHGFETIAADQQLSHHHLQSYLETADAVLEHAFDRALRGDQHFQRRLDAQSMARRQGGNYRGPQQLGEVCHFWPITLQFYGRMPRSQVPETGWYRITLHDVRAVNPRNASVWGTLRSGACASSSPMLYPVGLVEATEDPRNLTFTTWIRAGHMLELKPNDATARKARTGARGGNVAYPDGRSLSKERCEGIEVRSIEIERVYPDRPREALRAKLFPGITQDDVQTLRRQKGHRSIYQRTITRFAERAFRRPTTPDQIAPYLDLALAALHPPEAKPHDALRAAYRAILCSPRFLTFVEPHGHLDDHAIAARLSYAIWNTMPDPDLRRAADEGQLSNPEEFRRQAVRLLADPRAGRFHASFTDQWLDLGEIDFTTPDRRLYRSFDEVVKFSMLAETRDFIGSLISDDASITNLLQSDRGVLNERLARFYGYEKLRIEAGRGMQQVALRGHPRSGLITQGAVLKVTANGTTTSPVVRGVWVNERLLGHEIPPPPADVPAVEPDIRGAVSIRDQLDKHRSSESCAACHRQIDPAGFALESFDAVGLYRARYGTRGDSAAVDPSGVTPHGEAFAGFLEWRAIYLRRPEQLARSFAKHFLTYATGAAPRFSDESELLRVVETCRKGQYGLRSLILSSLNSEIFRNK